MCSAVTKPEDKKCFIFTLEDKAPNSEGYTPRLFKGACKVDGCQMQPCKFLKLGG